MNNKLNEKLIEIKERLRKKKRLVKLLTTSNQRFEDEKRKLKNLSTILKKEEYDVKKLEDSSLTALFYQILGNKENKLNKERQEFLAAKLKYDSCTLTISSLEHEIYSFEIQIKKLGDPDSDYEVIFTQKEHILTNAKNAKLLQLLEKHANLKADNKEIQEAINAGKNVLAELANVLSSLKSAGNWGTFDLIGGGVIATAVKHSKIDNAKQGVQRVQQLLHRFHDELSDVDINPESDMGIEIGSFNTFADYFFDGLIFDWVVQSKINRSLQKTKKVNHDISLVIGRLQNQLDSKRAQLITVEKEKKGFIENFN